MSYPTIGQVASRGNLELAWVRIRTASNLAYKNYFRHIYQAFALDAENTLETIRQRLLTGTFQPSTSTKFFFPKPTGILRPITLLTIEDQIVYQAFGNTIADRLVAQVGSRYHHSVFGNLYAGKNNIFFYSDWRDSYRFYTTAMRRAFRTGYRWSASFDLTACYDSIDHSVLKYFLHRIGLDAESCDTLCGMLSHWTEASGRRKPLYHGHGIPQGPQASGILSEAVLRHFDDARRPKGVRYFRYVDDIRIFGKNADSVRTELFKLDLRSKEIGLFPQVGKIDVHRVTSVDEEIKSLSNPPELGTAGRTVSQSRIRRRLTILSPRLRISNPTRFKFVLSQASPNSRLAMRLLGIVRGQPSAYEAIFWHLGKYPQLSRRVSQTCMEHLRGFQLWPSFSAALVRAVQTNIHSSERAQLHSFCRSRLTNRRRDWNPELRAVAAGCLIRDGAATWAQTSFNARWVENWWVRTEVVRSVDIARVGPASLEELCNQLIRDDFYDVAIVATQVMLTNGLSVSRPRSTIHPAAQRALHTAGMIGRVSTRTCFINEAAVELLGPQLHGIQWRKVFSKRGAYKSLLPKFARWRAYATTDPTAWVALTDTLNDVIIDSLFRHDGTIGRYTLGNIGSTLGTPTSRFARKYPSLFAAADRFHRLRLEADISHSVTRSTQMPTRRIRFAELRPLKPLLARAYVDLWAAW